MKALLSTVLTLAIVGSSQMAWANSCQSVARDLYTAQGYQQRCAYQLKQTSSLSAQLKEKCSQELSGADKNKILNEVNSQLNQAFQASKKDACDAGKKKFD